MLADIVADCHQLVLNTQGLTIYIQNASQSLTAILHQLGEANFPTLYNTIKSQSNTLQNILIGINLTKQSVDNIYSLFADFADYFLTWTGDMSLMDLLLDVHEQIDNAVNPLSDDNIDDWNSAVDNFQDNTLIGQLSSEGIQNRDLIQSALNSNNVNSHIYVNTLPASLGGAVIPARTIDIDMSWYGSYRSQAHSVVSAFLIIAYAILTIRAIPSLLGGVAPIIDSVSSMTDLDVDSATRYGDGIVAYYDGRGSRR